MKDYYEVLRIHNTATLDEIREAYKRMAHKCHPDVVGGSDIKFKSVNQAYGVLSNPKTRIEYDMQIIIEKYNYKPEPSQERPEENKYENKGLSKASLIFIGIIMLAISIYLL